MRRFSKQAARPYARRTLAHAIVFLLASTVTGASAPNDPARVCDWAAQRAARESGVPVQILRAITRTETGRTFGGTFGPWPWTVNHAGRGLWFEQRAEAFGYIAAAQRDGARNFDVGCFQTFLHQLHHTWTQFGRFTKLRFCNQLKLCILANSLVGANHLPGRQ